MRRKIEKLLTIAVFSLVSFGFYSTSTDVLAQDSGTTSGSGFAAEESPVILQDNTPGEQQDGHMNISGVGIFGSKVGIGPISSSAGGNPTKPVTGQVFVQENNTMVFGLGTLFTQELSVGSRLRIGEEVHTVGQVINSTTLIINSPHSTSAFLVSAFTDGSVGLASPEASLHVKGDMNSDLLLLQDGSGDEKLLVDKDGNVKVSTVGDVGAVDGATKILVHGTDDVIKYTSASDLALGGTTGPAGPQGPTGPGGPAGADGADGPGGPAGADGADGSAGADGAKGDKGSKGDKGKTGDDGKDGDSYWKRNIKGIYYNESGRRVGIGTDSPDEKLEVKGNILADKLIDRDNKNYWIDPDGTSTLRDAFFSYALMQNAAIKNARLTNVTANKISDSANTSYYIHSSQDTKLNKVYAKKIDVTGQSSMTTILANIYRDRKDLRYYVDPSGVSNLKDVRASIFRDITNLNYYVDPASTSVLNSVRVKGGLYATSLPFGDRRNVQWDKSSGRFFYDNSSRRYKENIKPLEDDFTALLKAEAKIYTRPGDPNTWELGFIAEDFHELGLTRLVDYDTEGLPDGINYEKICLYLTENAKIQQAQIEQLKTEIKNIKAVLVK